MSEGPSGSGFSEASDGEGFPVRQSFFRECLASPRAEWGSSPG